VLSLEIFPSFYPGRTAGVYWSLGLLGALSFFASIVLHELGHSMVARHYGIPVKSITLFLFGGVAQIARDAPRPRAEFLMALAGPAVSVGLGVLFLGLRAFVLTGETPAGHLVEWLGLTNIVLALFNLLPGFPMDGGRLLRSTLWGISGNFRMATRVAGWLGRGMALVLVAVGTLSALQPSWWPLADPAGGVWLIVVGLFLNNAAGQAQVQSRLIEGLRRYRAEQIMEVDVPIVPAEATIRAIVFESPPVQGDTVYFVYRDGRLVGLLARDRLIMLPPDRWGTAVAADLMIPAERIRPVSLEEDGAVLMQRMDLEELPGLPVVSGGVVAGLVTRARLLSLMLAGARPRVARL